MAKKATKRNWLKESGRSLVWLALTPNEKKRLRMAAAEKDVPMSEFARIYVLQAVDKILKNGS